MQKKIFGADWMIVLIYIALLVFGWFSVCGATHEIGDTNFFDWTSRSGKQLVWMVCACGLGFVILWIDDRIFDAISIPLYVVMMLVLFITPFLAVDTKGSLSWIKFGSVSLQPAEFAKFVTALALSKLINQYGFTLNSMANLAKAAAFVLVPMFLIIMQKETGSALVYTAFFLMFYREGMPGSILFTALAAVIYFVVGIRFAADILPCTYTSVGEFAVLICIWVFSIGMLRIFIPKETKAIQTGLIGLLIILLSWLFSTYIYTFDISWVQMALIAVFSGRLIWKSVYSRVHTYYLIAIFAICSVSFLYLADYALSKMPEHQQTRINVLLGTETNNRGAGYNVNQSKIAIGSGGLYGKGFMNGTQTKLKYVPEQDTDFIFCTVGEEEGFFGASCVLLLFLALILRLIVLSERQQTNFGRVYGYCVLSIFLFHVVINIGMVIGLTPVIGIPLPFFSYGGSSLWGFTILLFVFLRIDAVDHALRRR